jgi:hypothetical protein
MTTFLNTETRFCKESQLLKPVAAFTRRQGFQLQRFELPFYEYRIDLYGFSDKEDATVAIELKLNNWRRALLQAMLYQLCADFVYIAMPDRSARRADHAEIKKNHVGLISVHKLGRCSTLIPARKHGEVRNFYRQLQIEYLRGYRHA